MKRNHNISLFVLLLALQLLVSCRSDNRPARISDSNISVRIQRFDSAFWQLDTASGVNSYAPLQKRYPDFLPLYTQRVLHLGHPDSASAWQAYRQFRADTAVQQFYTDALSLYADLSSVESQLSMAFRRAQYHFPEFPVPEVYIHFSGLNQSVVVGNGFLSFSGDCYLGADYPLYDRIGIYRYLRQCMTPERVPGDCLTAWLVSCLLQRANTDLLSDMIYHGKIIYTVSQLLPDTPHRTLMGYTPDQWQWARNNERRVWQLIISSRHIYSNNPRLKDSYLSESPFTAPVGQDSPGRLGIFIGWQIVRSYMRSNPGVSIQQLLYEPNAQLILNQSDYQP